MVNNEDNLFEEARDTDLIEEIMKISEPDQAMVTLSIKNENVYVQYYAYGHTYEATISLQDAEYSYLALGEQLADILADMKEKCHVQQRNRKDANH